MDKMTKRKFIDKWGCEPDEEAPAFVQEIDSKNYAEFLEDLDKLINSIKEDTRKEMIDKFGKALMRLSHKILNDNYKPPKE